MSSVAKLSQEQLRLARKAGFRKKQPKKPKRNASVSAMENYLARQREWCREAKSKISETKKKNNLRKKIHGV